MFTPSDSIFCMAEKDTTFSKLPLNKTFIVKIVYRMHFPWIICSCWFLITFDHPPFFPILDDVKLWNDVQLLGSTRGSAFSATFPCFKGFWRPYWMICLACLSIFIYFCSRKRVSTYWKRMRKVGKTLLKPWIRTPQEKKLKRKSLWYTVRLKMGLTPWTLVQIAGKTLLPSFWLKASLTSMDGALKKHIFLNFFKLFGH